MGIGAKVIGSQQTSPIRRLGPLEQRDRSLVGYGVPHSEQTHLRLPAMEQQQTMSVS